MNVYGGKDIEAKYHPGKESVGYDLFREEKEIHSLYDL